MPVLKRMSSGALTGSDLLTVNASHALTNNPLYVKLSGALTLVNTSPSTSHNVYVAAKTTAALAAALSSSVVGDTIIFGAGVYPLPTNFVFLEGRTYVGQGIYAQNGGASGTWLQGSGNIQWGASVTIQDMLIGKNGAGLSTRFIPVPRGSSAAGSDTNTNGAHDVAFNRTRFKGGSDAGGNVFDTGNGGGYWSLATNPLKKRFMVNHTFTDCEFERPQSPNSYGIDTTFTGGNPGMSLALWFDCRPGGAQLSGNRWNRVHFGVKNGYHSGVDGYGIGTCVLVQGGPSTYRTTNAADMGPNKTGSSLIWSPGVAPLTNGVGQHEWNPNFDWSQVDHCPTDNAFTDCLFEYANWYPMDLVDWGRDYSQWHGVQAYLNAHPGGTCTDGNAAAGWGNPPGSQWVNIPDRLWIQQYGMTRCYLKGSTPKAHSVVGEMSAHGTYSNSYCGSGSICSESGKFGNVVSGSFSNANRPHTALFPVDWTGSGTSYTASPYDPA